MDNTTSLFEDYVKNKDASQYATVHKVAQVVARTFGGMKSSVETEAAKAGYSDPDVILDALVDIVVQRVMDPLSTIVLKVEEKGADFDADTVAGEVVEVVNQDDPISETTISEEIERAQTVPAKSSLQTVLQSGGSYWIDIDRKNGEGNSSLNLEYGKVSLAEDEKSLAEEHFFFDPSSGWVQDTKSSGADLLVVDGQWQLVDDSEGAGSYLVSFDSENGATLTHKADGSIITVSASEIDLAGKKIAMFVKGATFKNNDAVFPDKAKGYQLAFANKTRQCQVFGDQADWTNAVLGDSSMALISTLGQLRDFYGAEGQNFLWIDQDYSLQFSGGGSVDIYRGQYDSGRTNVGQGTWEDTVIGGKWARFVSLPEKLRAEGDFGQIIYVEWDGSMVKQGECFPAGYIDVSENLDCNKVAFDALEENLSKTGYQIDYAYLQYRTFADPSNDRPQGWIEFTGPQGPIAEEDITAMSIFDASGASIADLSLSFWAGDESIYNCLHGSCFETAYSGTGFSVRNLPADLAEGVYTYQVETTDGKNFSWRVYYPGQVALPVVDESTMSARWVQGSGLELKWENPSQDANWSEVDQVRAYFFDTTSEKTFFVNLPSDAQSVTIPGDVLARAGISGDSANLLWRIQLRAYGANKSNYARSYSANLTVPQADFRVGYAWLQYRTFADPSMEHFRAQVGFYNGELPIDASSVQSLRIKDAEGEIVADTGDFQFLSGEDVFYNCWSGTCSYGPPSPWYEFHARDLPQLPWGKYTLEVVTADGVPLTRSIDYQGYLALPVVNVQTMESAWLGGDLVLSWTNPVEDANWQMVDQLRLDLFDANNEMILHVKLPYGATEVILPQQLLEEVSALGDTSAMSWKILTRAYDENNLNYARGYSDAALIQ